MVQTDSYQRKGERATGWKKVKVLAKKYIYGTHGQQYGDGQKEGAVGAG